MNAVTKNLMFWMVAALTIFIFWSLSARIQKNERQLSFSEFMEQLERGHVDRVTITGSMPEARSRESSRMARRSARSPLPGSKVW